jgi:hypothetical protein
MEIHELSNEVIDYRGYLSKTTRKMEDCINDYDYTEPRGETMHKQIKKIESFYLLVENLNIHIHNTLSEMYKQIGYDF